MLFIKKKKKEEEKKLKKVELGESCVLQLKKFEFKKIEDAHKKLHLIIYDNRLKEKFYLGETLGEFIFKSTEMGLAYSDVSDQMLLALVPELSKYEGSFFGQKIILDFDGKKEERYPVFFSIYRKDFFNNKEVEAHITGFAYVSRGAVVSNKMISIQKNI